MSARTVRGGVRALCVAAALGIFTAACSSRAPELPERPLDTALPTVTEPAPIPSSSQQPAAEASTAATHAPSAEAQPTIRPGTTAGGPIPTVTYATWTADSTAVEVSGLVPSVVESGGTCTAVVVVDGTEHTAQVTALADASSTVCGTIRVPVSAGGTASVRLDYTSSEGETRSSETVEASP